MIPLTAELFARAVIASAVHYGDDPEVALTSKQRYLKRSAVAAALGVQVATGEPLDRVGAILGLGYHNLLRGQREPTPGLMPAVEAAREAVAYHLKVKAERAAALAALAALDGELLDPAVPQARAEPAGEPAPQVIEPLDSNRRAPRAPPIQRPEPAVIQPPPRPAPSRPAAKPAAKPGAISSHLQPPAFRSATAASAIRQADRPITDLVLEALADGPANSLSLSSIIDRKELQVSSALSQLAHEGWVVAEAVENGPRPKVWSLAQMKRWGS